MKQAISVVLELMYQNNDLKVLNEIKDMYINKTKWHIDKSSSSSLYYTSIPKRKVSRFSQRVEIPEGPSINQIIKKLSIPWLITFICCANLLSFILPNFIFFTVIAVLSLLSVQFLSSEYDKLQNPELIKDENEPIAKPYLTKHVTHLFGLPDDVAKALTDFNKRKEWDTFIDALAENDSKFVFHKINEDCCEILEIRNPDTKYSRETLFEISKIKSKPYYLRMAIYTSVTEDMIEKVDYETIANNMNWLRNYVIISDSVADMNLSLSNLRGTDECIEGDVTLTITDLIAEIEEIDEAEDGASDIEEDSKLEKEEIKQQKVIVPVYPKEISFGNDIIKPSNHEINLEEEKIESIKIKEEVKLDVAKMPTIPANSEKIPESSENNKKEENEDKSGNEVPEVDVPPVTPEPEVTEEEKKVLTFEEQFEQELAECPKEEHEFIRKAFDTIHKLTELAESPEWEKSEEK